LALYISSVNRNSLTISGPPRLLTEFLSSGSSKYSLLPIEVPYHAPHVFIQEDVDRAVGNFHDPSLNTYSQRLKIISIASGRTIASSDFRDLISGAVSEVLLEPLHWDLAASSMAAELGRHGFADCNLYPVSFRGVSSLASALTANTALRVDSLDSLEEMVLDPPPVPTGDFSQSGIAIIGYSGRFPESASNEEFWDLLYAGRDVHRTIPEDRFDWKAHYDPTGKTKNTSRVKYGCFINQPGLFDARFFNMSPREAENSDPGQRLAITSAYEAIEMAGLVPNTTPSTQQDRIGVFYGATSDDWREVNSGQDVDTYFIPGGNRAFTPGRIR
jgi:naphtho-gamma-pyrone polyketide synthase